MSPEPTQEPIEETLNAPNLPLDARVTNDSDSENDEIEMAGYMPLSQVPQDSDLMLDEYEDEEWIANAGESSQALQIQSLDTSQECPVETIEVWSSTHNRASIDMDVDKIHQIMSMMASFKLPTTALPDWVNTISEDQWKEQLIGRIKEMQSKEK